MKMDMHLHSRFSDGENTIQEMTDKAIELGYKEIAFTDHVWKTTDWLDNYIAEINRLREKYPVINIFSGIEAKVLNLNGDIDAREDFFEKVDVVLAAFHRIPRGEENFLTKTEVLSNKEKALDLWYQAFMKALENENIHIMAHPTAVLKRHEIDVPLSIKRNLAKAAGESGRIFEINIRHQVPDDQFLDLLRNENVRFSFGSDSHSVAELEASSKRHVTHALPGLSL